jgi:hypothetical protein
MENKENTKRKGRYRLEGIGTITALLTIITISIILVSVFSVI